MSRGIIILNRDVGCKLARPLTLPLRQVASWIIANALILQLVLSPIVMFPVGGIGAGADGVTAFALCTHAGESQLPADGKGAACQLCLICSSVSLLPDPSRIPAVTARLVPVQWTRLAVTVPRSRRLAQERSRGPPRAA